MRKVWRTASAVIAILLTGYFIQAAFRSLDAATLRAALSSPGVLAATLIASALYALIIPITGIAWRGLLLRQGESQPTSRLITILGLTQAAKYVPGNVAQHASRVELARRSGIPIPAYITSVIHETALAVAASIVVGCIALACSKTGWGQTHSIEHAELLWAGLIGSLLVCIAACVRFDPSSRLRSSRYSTLRHLGPFLSLPGRSPTLRALSAYSLNYLLVGSGVWLIAIALDLSNNVDFPLAVAAFSLSWLLGFLAPGAPAGLGAREAIMLLLLAGTASDEMLVLLVTLSRVATLIGDLAVFALACLAAPKFLAARHPYEEHTT